MNKLIVIRHSERLDEVDKAEWKNIILRHSLRSEKNDGSSSNIRSRYSFQNDPPITDNGKSLARDMANTVFDIISKESNVRIKLFSSKLIRCIQTSYELAQRVGGPIYVSSGLALTAQAVADCDDDGFEFLSIEEIREYCPGVEIVCCDSPDSPHYIPQSNWLAAVEGAHFAKRAPEEQQLEDGTSSPCTYVSLLVAHRETIRNMLCERLALPYCCIASFVNKDESSDDSNKKPPEEKITNERYRRSDKLDFQWLIDKDGKLLRS
eukprot:gene28217-37127_t